MMDMVLYTHNQLQDRVPCSEIRGEKIIDLTEYTLKQKMEMSQTYSKNEGQ